ncbi:MAG: photosystem reaction center subunit H [Methanotrichaceae archaeon]|nr:photosystem reaction center subunit H [Methanotrichaceae archaeon]
MAEVFAASLAGKEIVNTSGAVLGDLENVVIDLESGELIDLVVKPGSERISHNFREDGKHVLIPFSSVVAIRDCIVIDESRAGGK